MKTYVPYTQIHPETRACLEPYEYSPIKMIGDDDYMRYFQQRWIEREPFINCEHDTVFHPKAIEDLERCPEEWCAFGVMRKDLVWSQETNRDSAPPLHESRFGEGEIPTLVLMKFGRNFMDRCPDVWDMMATIDDVNVPKWRWCDWWLHMYTRWSGITCHQHYPLVVNQKEGQSSERV